MKYYSTIKKGISSFFNNINNKIVTWINLEDITPSEMGQTEKDKYCTISPTGGI